LEQRGAWDSTTFVEQLALRRCHRVCHHQPRPRRNAPFHSIANAYCAIGIPGFENESQLESIEGRFPCNVRNQLSTAPNLRPVARKPSPYGERWWTRAAPKISELESYGVATRRPFPSLLIVLPLLAVYEIGVVWVARVQAPAPRSGIDIWIRDLLARGGLSETWLPPVALVFGLVTWQMTVRSSLRLRSFYALGMLLEGMIYALVLLALSRVVDAGLSRLEHASPILQTGTATDLSALRRLLSFIGAGIYEEAVFRLALIPLIYGAMRALLVPKVMAGALAIAASSCLFSLAHHAGAPGEAFTWFAFVFRWLAGFSFAWIFVLRGFGIVVATHVFYDCFVGMIATG
jgi:hypothetical protein